MCNINEAKFVHVTFTIRRKIMSSGSMVDGLYFLKLTKYLDRTGEHIYLQNASNWDSN